MKVLEFSYNHICGNKLAEAVANGLEKNPVLEVIYLDHCSIEDEGMGALIGSITRLPEIESQLRVLRFHGNLVSDGILDLMGTAFHCSGIQIDKMMPDQAKKHYNEFVKEDEAQLLKQRDVVKEDLDDPEARKELVHHQREICRLAAHLMILCDDDDDDDRESTRKTLRQHKDAIKKIVQQEINRIAELTKNTTKYYQIAGIRWKMLEDITMDNKATEPHIQPHGFGATQDTVRSVRARSARNYDCASLVFKNHIFTSEHSRTQIQKTSEILDISDDKDISEKEDDAKTEEDITRRNTFDSALLYAQICARNMNLYYQVALETVINMLNSAKSILDIQLESSPCSVLLDFDDTDTIQGVRALLKFGPVKRCERAGVKSMEKQMEIDQGLLPSRLAKTNGGRALCGVDYVLDWLRATVVTKDPYVLYVTFMMLEECKVLRIHRVKNKFFDHDFPPNIRTNALINLMLL